MTGPARPPISDRAPAAVGRIAKAICPWVVLLAVLIWFGAVETRWGTALATLAGFFFLVELADGLLIELGAPNFRRDLRKLADAVNKLPAEDREMVHEHIRKLQDAVDKMVSKL